MNFNLCQVLRSPGEGPQPLAAPAPSQLTVHANHLAQLNSVLGPIWNRGLPYCIEEQGKNLSWVALASLTAPLSSIEGSSEKQNEGRKDSHKYVLHQRDTQMTVSVTVMNHVGSPRNKRTVQWEN